VINYVNNTELLLAVWARELVPPAWAKEFKSFKMGYTGNPWHERDANTSSPETLSLACLGRVPF